MSKQKSLILLKMLMGILNFAILTFLAVIILYTIGMVRATYTARSFLNHITYLPMNPVKTVIVMYVALFTLVAIINLRQQSENSILNQTIYILEVILCGIIICCVYMEYKGIIFLVIADIVVLIRDKTSQKVFLVIMGLIYIFADYDIISLGIKMVSFRELLNVYTVRQHMLMTGILNFLSSVNAIAFIAYMIIYMRSQIKEKERVTILNQQLAEANVQLSEMNNQLKDYAAMQKQMGEIEERNRIAREIHDNVGHVLSRSILMTAACKTINKNDSLDPLLGNLEESLNGAMNSIRSSVHDLHDDAIDLEDAIKGLVKDFTFCPVNLTYDMSRQIPREVKYSLISITKEGLSNVMRHSNADSVDILLREHPALYQLCIEDNGTPENGIPDIQTGSDSNKSKNTSGGMGLSNIRDRAKALGGTVQITQENGFRIFVTIPKSFSN